MAYRAYLPRLDVKALKARGYQSRLVLKFCLLAAGCSLLFSAMFYFVLDQKIPGGYAGISESLRLMRGRIMSDFLLLDGAAVALLAVCVVGMTLLMSHRFAGPAYRLSQVAKDVGRGNLSVRIKLRKSDEATALAGEMNRMIDSLGGRIREVNVSYYLLKDCLLRLNEFTISPGRSPDDCRKAAMELADATRRLKESLSAIKTE